MGTKLYVGNLNYNTTEDSLRQAFSANGREVTSVSIIMDRETGRSRGFAFVEMATAEGAQEALKELDGFEVDGRQLRINEAREREPRGAGGPRNFGPRPAGGGYGGPPGGGYNSGPPRGPGPGPGGFGGPPGGGFRPPGGGGFRPPGSFGSNAPPGGNDRRRREKEKEKERGAGDDGRGGKQRGGAKRRGADDDEW